MKLREHPAKIAVALFHSAYLILLPLIRVFFPEPHVLASALGAVGLALAALGWALLQWRFASLSLTDGILTLERGVLIRAVSRVRTCKIAAVHFQAGLFLRTVRAVRVTVETDCIAVKRQKLTIYAGLADARQLAACLCPDADEGHVQRASVGDAFLCALTSSDFSLGLLTLASVLNLLGKLFNHVALTREFFQTLTQVQIRALRFIPSAFTALALLVLLGYAVSILRLTEQNMRFVLSQTPAYYKLSRGVLTRRTVLIQKRLCPLVLVRQSPIMRLCNRAQPIAATPGYRHGREKPAFLLPLSGCAQAWEAAFARGCGYDGGTGVRIPKRTVWRVYIPVIALSGAGCSLSFFGLRAFPGQVALFAVGTCLFCIAAVAMIFPMALRERRGALSKRGDWVETTRFFSCIRSSIPGRPGAVIVTASPFQAEEDLCTVTLRPRTGAPVKLQLANLDSGQVRGVVKHTLQP